MPQAVRPNAPPRKPESDRRPTEEAKRGRFRDRSWRICRCAERRKTVVAGHGENPDRGVVRRYIDAIEVAGDRSDARREIVGSKGDVVDGKQGTGAEGRERSLVDKAPRKVGSEDLHVVGDCAARATLNRKRSLRQAI